MRKLLVVFLLALPLCADTTVTLLHFSDYHSHALPFYTDEGERGGIARAMGYLRLQKKAGALVFSGGDTVNKGAPAWSDKYGCVEWQWLNGIVDAMAFGNHDADYGREELDRCQKTARYPILSANTPGFRKYVVLKAGGARIGVFALAGPDFQHLVKVPGLTFGNPIAAARDVVRTLREEEKVDAVVMIGHEDIDEDEKLAKAVPGIDVIFGSHSHLKRDLTRIAGTDTATISPSQYLTYISRLELTLGEGRVTSVKGGLIPVDASMPEDRKTAQRVRNMQRELEGDPRYRDLFTPIGTRAAPLSTEELAKFTVETMRNVAGADVALSTKSSFRSPLPQGTLTMELLRAAMPYDNEIIVCTMDGPQLQRLLDTAGPDSITAGSTSADPAKSYRVATTDYLANVAYKEVFVCDRTASGLKVREEVRKKLVQ